MEGALDEPGGQVAFGPRGEVSSAISRLPIINQSVNGRWHPHPNPTFGRGLAKFGTDRGNNLRRAQVESYPSGTITRGAASL